MKNIREISSNLQNDGGTALIVQKIAAFSIVSAVTQQKMCFAFKKDLNKRVGKNKRN